MTRPTLTQSSGPAHTRILGLGGVRGELTVTNDELVGPIDSSDEWIRQRTGIITRRRAGADTDVLDLAEGAARAALDDAGLTGADIDAVILSTVTYFHQTPSGAAILADRIGATPAAAYDISAACAGYCYGIGQADALVRSGAARHVLVVGAEKMSEFIDPTDRSISFLLGDGAGAAVVGPSDFAGIGPTIWGSDGSRAKAVGQTHSWMELRDNPELGWPTLRQDGQSVFKWAAFEMPKIAQQALDAAGVTADQIQAFIPHQANQRILQGVAHRLGLDEAKVVSTVAHHANTSAASIPLALAEAIADGRIQPGQLLLLEAMGGGFTWGACVLRL